LTVRPARQDGVYLCRITTTARFTRLAERFTRLTESFTRLTERFRLLGLRRTTDVIDGVMMKHGF